MPHAATFVDLAPTFLDIAGVALPEAMDGKSMLPLFHGDQAVAQSWRTEVFLEYYYVADNTKCVGRCDTSRVGTYPERDEMCVDLIAKRGCWAGPDECPTECYPTESLANNFRAIRQIGGGKAGSVEEHGGRTDLLYAEFATGNQDQHDIDFSNLTFHELYHTADDPWHTNNLYAAASQAEVEPLAARVRKWFECAGRACP